MRTESQSLTYIMPESDTNETWRLHTIVRRHAKTCPGKIRHILPSGTCPVPSGTCPVPSGTCHTFWDMSYLLGHVIPSGTCPVPSGTCPVPSGTCPTFWDMSYLLGHVLLCSGTCPIPSGTCPRQFLDMHFLPSGTCPTPFWDMSNRDSGLVLCMVARVYRTNQCHLSPPTVGPRVVHRE